jgi:hypothetical protein
MSHYHGESSGGLSGAMTFILLLVIAAVVAIAVIAWAPWNDDGDETVIPGQGGDDGPVQELVTPAPPRSTPGVQITPPSVNTPAVSPNLPQP